MNPGVGERRVVIAAGGTIETAYLPYQITHLKSFFDIGVEVALTRKAETFVSALALTAITRSPVYTDEQPLKPGTTVPFHIHLSEADLLVVFPATPRLIVECAMGNVTCPVTRAFAFFPRQRAVMVPFLHPRMHIPTYVRHLVGLADTGCTVLRPSDDEWLWTSSPWRAVEEAIAHRLAIVPHRSAPEIMYLEDR